MGLPSTDYLEKFRFSVVNSGVAVHWDFAGAESDFDSTRYSPLFTGDVWAVPEDGG